MDTKMPDSPLSLKNIPTTQAGRYDVYIENVSTVGAIPQCLRYIFREAL